MRKNCGPGLPGMYSVSHLQTTVMTNTFSQRTLRAEGGAGDHRKKLLMLSLGLLTESIVLWFYAESMEASSYLLMLVLGGHSAAALSMCREHLTPRLGTC